MSEDTKINDTKAHCVRCGLVWPAPDYPKEKRRGRLVSIRCPKCGADARQIVRDIPA